MKKLLSLIAIMAFGLTATFAQTPTPATKTTTVKKVAKKEVKTPAVAAKAEVKTAPAKVTTTTKVERVKKDGTPDMRFKENKTKAVTKPAGPLKKDGTADMRYKANKPAKKN